MKLHPRTLVVALLLVLLAAIAPTSHAQPPDRASDAREKVAPPARTKIMERMAETGRSPVLVQVDVAALRELGRDAPSQARRGELRERISDRQARVLARLPARVLARLKRYRNLPFLALDLGPGDLATLEQLPEVVSIEPDRLHAPDLGASVPHTGGDGAWAVGATGAGQAVAILDTGVDAAHPFFQTTSGTRVVEEACFSTNSSGLGSTSLCTGGQEVSIGSGAAAPCSRGGCDHGTHVAGIAAGDDAVYAGVAPEASIIAIQVFSLVNKAGTCSNCILAWTSDLVAALDHVLDLSESYSIAAVNMSLGGDVATSISSCPTGTAAAIGLLRDAGIATVVSAGNDGRPDGLASPGCVPAAVTVGATSNGDAVLSFSNGASWMDFFAPGGSIRSAVPGTGTAVKSGTSMAAPHVAGAIAALRSLRPDATLDELLATLATTAEPVADPDNGYVIPRIQVDTAANLLLDEANLPVIVVADDDLDNGSVEAGNFATLGVLSAPDAYGGQALRGAGAGDDIFRFSPDLPRPGIYRVHAWWPSIADAPQAAAYDVFGAGGAISSLDINQRTGGGEWNLLGDFNLSDDGSSYVELVSGSTPEALADAVRFEYLSLRIEPFDLPLAFVGATYNETLPVTGGLPPYLVTPLSLDLPPGLSFDASTLTVSGTATTDSDGVLSLEIRDADGDLVSGNFPISARTPRQISGEVTLDGAPLEGVAFSALPGGSCTDSDAAGGYTCTVPDGWSGVVAPALERHVFTPPSRSYDDLTADEPAENYAAAFTPEIVWVEDALPAGAQAYASSDGWNWVASPVLSGALAHRSPPAAGIHQHYFLDADLPVSTGDVLFTHVYLDPANPPREIMLQFNTGTWNRRAYWGENLINWGANGTVERRYMGPLPPSGQWVRLEIPAADVGLEGATLKGIGYTLHDGSVTWDRTGSTVATSEPAVGFSNTAFVAGEADGEIAITVTRSGSLSQTSTVAYAITPGTAAPGSDYVATGGILNFASGQAQRSFTITLLDDFDSESDETLALSLSDPDGARLGIPSSATLTLVDDDVAPPASNRIVSGAVALDGAPLPGVSLAALPDGDCSDTDAAGTYSCTVPDGWTGIVTPALAGHTFTPVSRGYSTLTADVPDADFVATLAAGETWIDDALPAGAQAVASSDGWNWVGAPVSSGALAHRSPPAAGIHQHYFVDADLPVSAGDVLFTDVYLDPASPPRQIMLQFNTGTWDRRAYWGENLIPWGTSGTAERRYVGPLPPAGQWVRLEIPAADVGLEGVVVRGIAFTLYNGAATWDRTGRTPANEGSSFAFLTANYEADESQGTKFIAVTRSGDLSQPASVGYTVTPGTATPGSDYVATTGGTLDFASGQAQRSVLVTVLDDTQVEADETVLLSLSAPSGAVLGTPASATLTLVDDDVAPPAPDRVISGTVAVDGAPLAGVSLAALPGGVCSDSDATGAYACTVPDGWTGTVTPSFQDYTFTPATRSYTELSADASGESYAAIPPPPPPPPDRIVSGTVTVDGAPLAGVSLAALPDGDCSDTDATGAYACTVPDGWTGIVTPALAGHTFTPASRSYSALAADAPDADFVATLAAGQIWIDDALPAGALAVASSDGWNWVGAPVFSGALAHRSPPAAGIHQHYFLDANLPVAAGDVLFTDVYLDPASPPRQIMLQFNTGTWNRRAYWGENLINWGVNGTVERRYMGPLPPAGQWVRLEIPAADVGLEGATLRGIAFTLYNGAATWDRTGRTPANEESSFAFLTPNYEADESQGTKYIAVTRSGDLSQPASVDFAITPGTATPGSDYAATAGGTLHFASGRSQRSFLLTMIDDTQVEADETVLLSLSAPDGAVLGTPASATLTIVDDDTAPPAPDRVVAGTVSVDGTPLAGVALAAPPDAVCTDSDATGAYSCSVPDGWTGTVTPSFQDYTFTPASRSYADLSADVAGQSYVAVPPPPPDRVVSGTVTVDDAPLAGVVLAATQEGLCTDSDATGAYSCSVPDGWTGTVTPSFQDYTFTPASRSYADLSADTAGESYLAVPPPPPDRVISGTVTVDDAPLAGVVLAATQEGLCTDSDATGAYSCIVPDGWTGTVTPSFQDYTFTPASRSYADLSADVAGQSYVAVPPPPPDRVVSGTVTVDDAPLAGVVLAATQEGLCTDSDATGAYSCSVPDGWTGTVTPSFQDYTFTPASRSYADLSADTAGESYLAVPPPPSPPPPPPPDRVVSGAVSVDGAPLPGVSVAAPPGGVCTDTDATGTYSCTVPDGWTGIVTPALAGHAFTPASRSYSALTADAPDADFVATLTAAEIWMDDALPAGAQAVASSDGWNWVNAPVASGALAHRSPPAAGIHQHYFVDAELPVSVGDVLFTDVYLDPANPPRQIMLQFNTGTWDRRAYWGENLIPWGTSGTAERRYVGPLPPAGQWVRLEIPAADVGLEGVVLRGIAFTLYDGAATWDRAGRTPPNEGSSFAFLTANYEADESQGTKYIAVTRSGDLSQPASVGYTITPGTATPGSDYVATSGTLNFASGQAQRSFTVTLVDDAVVEGDETVLLSLTTPSGALLGTPATATLNVADDDDIARAIDRIISGTVRRDGAAFQGVALTALPGGACTTTDSTGAYSCTVPDGWTGTVTPSAFGHAFNPASRSYSGVVASITGADFAAVAAPGVDVSRMVLTSLDGSASGERAGIRLNGFANLFRFGEGASIVGDLNGDGFDDVAAGNDSGRNQGFIVFGNTTAALGGMNGGGGLTVDGIDGANGFTVNGASFPTSGVEGIFRRAAGGDIDGDGVADLVLGDRGLSGPQQAHAVLGGQNFDAMHGASLITGGFDLGVLAGGGGSSGATFDLFPRVATSDEPVAVASGDFDGDGFADVLMGQPYPSTGAGGLADAAGTSFLVWGDTGGALAGLGALPGGNAGAQVTFSVPVPTGTSSPVFLGRAVTNLGDINGDGIDDLAVSAVQGSTTFRAPRAYVVFGGRSNIESVAAGDLESLDGSNGGFRVTNSLFNGAPQIGTSISGAGDFNGDGLGDFLVGAPGPGGISVVGVLFGRSGGFGNVDLASLTGTPGGGSGFASQGFVVIGPAGQRDGTSVAAAGDVNGDGLDDIVVGAPNALSGPGAAYVIFGTANPAGLLATFDNDTPADPGDDLLAVLPGEGGVEFDVGGALVGKGVALVNGPSEVFGALGSAVSGGGSVNGDGFDDVVVGAPAQNSATLSQVGQAYVVYGQDFNGALAAPAGSPLAADGNGQSLIGSSAGDVMNGGGFSSLVMRGGAGNDTLRFDFDNARTMRVDGGGDTATDAASIAAGAGDTLGPSVGGGLDLDFTAALPSGARTSALFDGIEAIDLSNAGNGIATGNNTVVLGLRDVLQMSDTSHVLRIDGDAGDSVVASGGWQAAGSLGGYSRYVVPGTAAVLLVDPRVTANSSFD